ncbi:MAG: DUF4123 domain-containing protein [Gemmatimonadetes bacterium]|nr:DUF4123 domain-containing protein [Gemmatimonadota bacterium]
MLVESGRSLEELLTHFQQFVTLLSPDGEEWFFRFYDPRVLPVYLESVTPEEREQFCAGVERLGTIGPELKPVWWYTRAPSTATEN